MANAGTWRQRNAGHASGFRGVARVATVGAFVAVVASAAPVRADDRPDKQTCVAAYEEAQQLRKESKLTAARARLLICAQDSCPAVVRKDCTVWLAEVEQATPTVVLAARSATGQDAVDVVVSLDGKPLTRRLDGKALPLDPGPHTFRFELPGAASPREETILLHEGERNRQVLADFQPPSVGSIASGRGPSGASAFTGSTGPSPMRPAPTPVGAYVLGGIGVAGLGVFTAFGLLGLSGKSDLDARGCRPGCPQADVDAVKQKFLAADIGLGVGAVSLGIATILYLARGEVPASDAAVAVDVLPAPGGGALGLRGAF